VFVEEFARAVRQRWSEHATMPSHIFAVNCPRETKQRARTNNFCLMVTLQTHLRGSAREKNGTAG